MKRQTLINRDINDFLEAQSGLDNNSKRDLLRNLIEKHIILTESPLLVDYYDTLNILTRASSIYSEMPVPIIISGKQLGDYQLSSFAVIESTIEFLNNKGAIKRLPKFK
jgi:hypothetical protein